MPQLIEYILLSNRDNLSKSKTYPLKEDNKIMMLWGLIQIFSKVSLGTHSTGCKKVLTENFSHNMELVKSTEKLTHNFLTERN